MLTIESYQDGYCHVFAVAVHLKFGYPIECVFETRYLPEKHGLGRGLLHAYCLHPDGDVIDAKGKREREQVHAEYKPCSLTPYEELIDPKELWEMIEKSSFPNIDTPSIVEALLFIPETYQGNIDD